MKRASRTKCWMRLVAPVLSLFLYVGCMRSAGSIPVNESTAQDACQQFLEAWQEGQTLEDLQPNITGNDYVWASGKKLLAFEILPNEFSDGTNLHIPVRLTIKDEKGTETKSLVSYAVGTFPSISVIRDEELVRSSE